MKHRSEAPSAIRARFTASIGLGAMIALSASGQALAATTWTDPVGDALFHAPPYADLVAASADENAGTFEFTMTVAGSIPETPRLTPPGVVELRWVATLDLDPTTNPVGWPLAPGAPQSAQVGAPEGFIAVAWDGSAFSATWYDRRPLLSGGEVVAIPVPFEINGDTVHVWLDGALIDDPASFGVAFVTVALPVLPGNDGFRRFFDYFQPLYNPWP